MWKSSLRNKLLISLILLGIFYVLLRLFAFSQDPILPALLKGISEYQSGAEKLANVFLSWFGSEVRVVDHTAVSKLNPALLIDSGVLLKKWFVFLLAVIWFTPIHWSRKIVWSVFLALLNFLMASVNIALLAGLSYPDLMSAIQIARTPDVLTMVTFLVLWILSYRTEISLRLKRWGIPNEFMQTRLKSMIVILYIFVILGNLVLGYFDFSIWVNFLLYSTRHLLSFFNVESTVNGNLLTGENANLYLGKACLGMKTILLFAAVVYLTGKKDLTRWIYIFAGILFINMVNIVRLVLLFDYIQKHNGYDLAMDVHNMYDYVIYAMIFILWIIWFELFTGLRNSRRSRPLHSGSS